MTFQQHLNLDLDSEDIKSEIEGVLNQDEYLFLLTWEKGKEIDLTALTIVHLDNYYSIISEPLRRFSGSLIIPIGWFREKNFNVQFRVNNISFTEDLKKVKAFLINKTKGNKVIKTSPTKKPKTILKGKPWTSKL